MSDVQSDNADCWGPQKVLTVQPCLAQRREPLTDAEIEEILHGEIALNPGEGCAGRFARAIERAHGIGATTGKEPGNV